LLGELAGHWMDLNQPGEQLVWNLTHGLRDRRTTPLTRFAGMLYELLNERRIENSRSGHTWIDVQVELWAQQAKPMEQRTRQAKPTANPAFILSSYHKVYMGVRG